jgi:uncharacterized membrane protein
MSAAATEPGAEGVVRCARHPNVETVLRCGRCETPICARCLVATPVGARCPACARVKRFGLLLKPAELARSIAFGLGVAAFGTLIVGYIPFLGLLGYMLMGFLTGEAVSVGANRKRARELGVIAVACVFVGYELGTVLAIVVQFQGRLVIGPEVFALPLLQLRQGLLLVGLLVGALLAWMRVR